MFESKIYDGNSVEILKNSILAEVGKSSQIKDASVTASGSYLEQQLTLVIPRVLTRIYPNMPALQIFGVSNEGSVEKILLRRIKQFNGLHYRENEEKSNPNKGALTVSYDASGMRIETFSASSEYKEIDLVRAAKFNDPLDESIIQAHDVSYKRITDKIAFLGMTDLTGNVLVEGLLNNSNVLSAISLNATAQFSTTSNGIQIYNDIAGLYNAMVGASGGAQELWPDTLVSSPAVIAKLHTTTYGAGITGSTTVNNIMSVAKMLELNLGINKIVATNNAVGLDNTTKDRLCLFNRNVDNMTFYIPKPLTFSEVAKIKFNYSIDSEFRVAGLAINQQVAFGYLKGC